MTLKQLQKIQVEAERQVREIRGRIRRGSSKKVDQSYKGLLAIAGMWKDNPRTEKDLAKVRARLWKM
ncbi:MAG: hypothetical protein WC802_05675 [Patescibacteria group bacterium]|jgi:hypothetical protein